jgi:hypothetical protein
MICPSHICHNAKSQMPHKACNPRPWADENKAVSRNSFVLILLRDREATSCPLSLREKRAELATARERAGVRGNSKRRSLFLFRKPSKSATKPDFELPSKMPSFHQPTPALLCLLRVFVRSKKSLTAIHNPASAVNHEFSGFTKPDTKMQPLFLPIMLAIPSPPVTSSRLRAFVVKSL